MLIEVIILVVFIVESGSSSMCYSCMSDQFRLNWPHLNEIYYRPLNFSDYCLTLPPDANIGHHIGNNIIRGCFTSVFRHGSSPRLRNRDDSGMYEFCTGTIRCTRLPAARLLPAHLARRASHRTLQLCSCFAERCNGYPTPSISVAIGCGRHGTDDITIFSCLLLCLLVFTRRLHSWR